ncbi:uncharacterized protein A1O9_10218 [Exophiala aquamarina CBS 119918]|uniref:Uncharacterized protein n=1 Tax=Exophiala aquamarina CBS 119918 TaxID=1182545 RepID=A0A072P2B2_9EURO|nr:uncharacterized protein A1O9_10218 [Exophiala aquamarina CBS 119918]KEF53817.1 hypothetical protein A1O9_10218 [Exophiala aquamarina CBS 119918]
MADTNSSKSGHSLTARELEVVCAALKNIKGGGEIQFDYTGMASTLGLKNEASACSMWAKVKKKLFTEGENVGSVPKSTKKNTKTAVSANEGAANGVETPNAGAGDASDEVATPVTPAAGTPKKRGRKSNAENAAAAMVAIGAKSAGAGATANDQDASPTKKARKTPAKKSAVAPAPDAPADMNADAGTIEATITESNGTDLEA